MEAACAAAGSLVPPSLALLQLCRQQGTQAAGGTHAGPGQHGLWAPQCKHVTDTFQLRFGFLAAVAAQQQQHGRIDMLGSPVMRKVGFQVLARVLCFPVVALARHFASAWSLPGPFMDCACGCCKVWGGVLPACNTTTTPLLRMRPAAAAIITMLPLDTTLLRPCFCCDVCGCHKSWGACPATDTAEVHFVLQAWLMYIAAVDQPQLLSSLLLLLVALCRLQRTSQLPVRPLARCCPSCQAFPRATYCFGGTPLSQSSKHWIHPATQQ